MPYFKVFNIQNQKIEFDQRTQYITHEFHSNKMKRSIIYPGDVIMNIVGPPLAKVAIVPDEYPESNINQNICIFRPIITDLNEWIYTYLCAKTFLLQINLVGSTGQDFMSGTKCKGIMVPLAPLKEQKAIVEKVNSLMALCDELEQEVDNSQSQIEQLMQSCLKEVFV